MEAKDPKRSENVVGELVVSEAFVVQHFDQLSHAVKIVKLLCQFVYLDDEHHDKRVSLEREPRLIHLVEPSDEIFSLIRAVLKPSSLNKLSQDAASRVPLMAFLGIRSKKEVK